MEETGGACTGRGSGIDAVDESDELRYPLCVSVTVTSFPLIVTAELMGVEGADDPSEDDDDSDVMEECGDLGLEQRDANAAAAACSLSLCGLPLLLRAVTLLLALLFKYMAFVIRFLSGADDDGPGDRDD